MKRCPHCATEKPLEDFNNNRRTKDGKSSWCRACNQAYAADNRERQRAYSVVYQQVRRKVKAEDLYYSHVQRKYGLSQTDYAAMLLAQDGACAICKDTFTLRPCVDHDHATGAIRGLLCKQCNAGLGHFRDSPTMLTTAISYLNRRITT